MSTESLSSTSNRRSGGMSSPILGASCKPSCQRCQRARFSSGLSGGWRRKRRENLGQFLLEPTMQDGIGTGGDAFHAYLASRWMKQGEQFGSPIFGIFMGLLARVPFWLPMLTRIRDGLIRARFILCPDRRSLLLGQRVRLLDQVFFSAASGSVTSTGPLFRTRMALPVSHQVRSCCHV